MFIAYFLELDIGANKMTVASHLTELSVPESPRHVNGQFYNTAGLFEGRNRALQVFRGDRDY